MEEAKDKIISELVKALQSTKQTSLQVHKRLLLESQKTNEIYVQILQALRHQNMILDELKRTDRITVSQ